MIYVGLSGGIDSMVLLHKLKQMHTNITAIHVNHHISPHSNSWEQFCRSWCENLDIAFIAQQVYLNAPTEEEARKHRYNAYRECCSEIYLGHHADDDVETILFKMIRGCGLSGLKGMMNNTTYAGLTIHRPLLSMTKTQIKKYAMDNKLEWVTDESNGFDSYSRNFLRNQIIPTLKTKFPTVINSMMRLKENVVEAEELITEVARTDITETNLCVDNILKLTPLRRRNLIRFYVKRELGNLPPSTQFNEFVRQLECAAHGKQPKMVVGNAVIGVKNKHLYHCMSPNIPNNF